MNPALWFGVGLVGLALGVSGAGGSMVTLPVLVYLGGYAPAEAVGMSLVIVGAGAFAGWLVRGWRGFHPRAAGWFGLTGVPGAWLGSHFTDRISDAWLMSGFAVMSVVVALRMLMGGGVVCEVGRECRPVRCGLAGLGVGVLTGFLGVGGGFLLVPALVKFGRIPVSKAVGTSLAVIVLNTVAAVISHGVDFRGHGLELGWFTLIAVAGVIAGSRWSARLPEKQVARAFASLMLVVAAGTLVQTWK